LNLFNEVPASRSQANVNVSPTGNRGKKKTHFGGLPAALLVESE
jgi:hypothetical protein